MDYFEIEGKLQLRRFGISTDECFLVNAPDDLHQAAFPCVVKSQVLVGKRGKSGGVRVVSDRRELECAVADISAMAISGHAVAAVLVSEFLHIQEEYYLGLTLDVAERSVLLLFTTYGGVDIEHLAATAPEKLLRLDCTEGFDCEAFRSAMSRYDLDNNIADDLCSIAAKMTKAFFALDATVLEINPLALTAEGKLVAADAKLVIDDNALYRQGDYTCIPRQETARVNPAQREAQEAGLIYVELEEDGDIGLIAGGAGIGMATVDTIKFYGGKPFNFLDLGGGVTTEKTYVAMRILMSNPQIRGIVINIFGGINNCADMAKGVEKAVLECPHHKKIVVKSRGFSQEIGWEIYARLGCKQVKYGSTDDAVQLLLKEIS